MDEAASDEQLMLQYRAGDAGAFDRLYARHRAPLYRYFLRQVRPAAVAEELFQDVWMNLIRTRGHYEVRAKFTTWLYRLAHNRLVDHYRRTAARAMLIGEDDPDAAIESIPDEPLREPENELDRRRLVAQLMRVLDELPAAQREAFLLREEGGLSLEEIAEATGTNVETAKSRLRYGLAKLRHRLRREDADTHRDERRN
jgi:RNA polymerase sigma-70 factor, ECF subfamily